MNDPFVASERRGAEARQLDAAALDRAAAVLLRRSRNPGSFWLKVIVQVLHRASARITEEGRN